MTPIRPYKISVYNRITGNPFAEFYSNQVPAKGDQISVFATHRNPEDPFDLWGRWVVDAVVWVVASPGSVTARAIAKETGSWATTGGYCDWAEIHVWPAQGPHWAETPKFAKALSPDKDADDEAAEVQG